MGETDGEIQPTPTETRETPDPDERATPGPEQDTLKVPKQKRRRIKSPTPGSIRGRSMTPIRGRSQTPFSLYLTRRSATPTTWRSITPFIKREEREKTVFELGQSIKPQLICNKAVFDKALVMDITESEIVQEPVRYITTDMSVIDRAAVMDVSNVEVIYVVEEYEEYEEYTEEEEKPEEKVEEETKKKKKKTKKTKETRAKEKKEKLEREKHEQQEEEGGEGGEGEKTEKAEKATKSKTKKDKKEKSPSPKLSLKLEMGGGAKASKKMFEEQNRKVATDKSKPPPKKTKSKMASQMEEQAKAAMKAAEEAKKREEEKARNKRETYEERQKRLKAEEEERQRREAEEALRQQDGGKSEEREKEIEEEEEDKMVNQDNEPDDEDDTESAPASTTSTTSKPSTTPKPLKAPTISITAVLQSAAAKAANAKAIFTKTPESSEASEEESEEESEDESEEEGGSSYMGGEQTEREEEEEEGEDEDEEQDKFDEEPRRGSASSEEGFTRPDPEEEERWKKIAEEEGEEFMQKMRKFSRAQAKSEKERDADWQKNREKARLPIFINYLTDRTAEVGHNVRLVCGVGGPDLSAKWYKDGKQIERGPRHRINNNNNVLSLEIVNTQITDSGEYACTISNVNDEVTSACFVTIYEVFKDEPSPPTFTLIRDFYHLHDDELTIECHCHGIPRPKITWIKDSNEIKPSFKYTFLEEAHGVYKLMIFRPSAKDSGKYLCRAKNESGEAEISHHIEFVKPKTFHVHGLFHAHDPLQKEKEEQARRAMEEAMKSKEEADKRRGIASERRNRGGAEELVPPKNKLKFATHLRDRIALEGATIKLACNVIGPDPAVRWLKDDKPLVWGPKVKNLSSEGKAVIQLTGVGAENSGVYKCIAKNSYTEIDTSCYLKVYSAQAEGDQQEPMFVLPMRDVYHSSENDLIIDTKVRGNPRPIITWLKDEMPVQTDARIQQIEHLDGICELIINKPLLKDGGKYCCVAENKLGTQKLSHSVVVENISVARKSSTMSITDEKEADTKQKEAPKEKASAKGKKKLDNESEGGRRRLAEPEPSLKSKVYFIAYLQNRYLATGSKVKLQAVVGGPDPQIKWLKNGTNVPYGPRIRNMSRENLAVLEINNVNEEDSGEYTVIARNTANEVTSSAQLVVYKPEVSADLEPMFTRSIKEKYHLNTNELILETHVRGQPNPTVVWVKDGVEIQNSEKYQIIEHVDGTCELVIDKPVNNDSGKYVVQAENRIGKAEISHHVLFEGKESHIADNIHGVFHADRQFLKKDKLKVEETEKEEQVGEEKGKGKKGKAKGKPAKEDPAPVKSADVKPEKEKREKRIGVHFAANLTDRVIAEGSRTKLTCYVEGPDPQVKWFKDDQPVVYGPKVRQNFREGLCTLELLRASESDSGVYKCYAKNNNGETSTTCRVTIYSISESADVPPTFTRAIKDTYHGKINELVLDCHVRGVPIPTITWVKDGVRIEPNEKYQQIEHEDGTCELVINDPVPYDSGKYVCQAENSVDKAEISHVVQLQARDIRPGSPPRELGEKPEAKDEQQEKKEEKKKKKTDQPSGGRRHEAVPLPDPKKKLYFGNFLSNRTVIEGSNLRMSVYINGPDPQCRWFRNEQPIVYGPKSKAACQDGLAVLVLSKLSVEDSGEYKLVARNTDSEIVTTCQLHVYEKVKEDKTAPVFTVGIKDNYYLNENELVLDCRVRGNPRPEIQWFKGNDSITSDDKYQQFDQANGYCKLVIYEPTEKDSGTYTCSATNEVSSDKISHTVEFGGREKFILSKTHGFFHRDPNKPHLTTHFSDHMVTLGGTIGLSAEFAPTSSPIDVQWLRNKVPISGQPNIKTFFEHGVYTLAIEKVTAECSGVYTCRASNAFGKTESHSNIHIVGTSAKGGGKAALFLSRPEPEMKIAVNDPFSISFRVQGEPKPKLILMKGTKDITKSDRVSKEASDDYIRFTVHKSQISDSGTYFVVARNQHGTDRIFTTVTVRQRVRSVTPTLTCWGQPLESYPEYSFFKNPPAPISSEPIVVDSGKNFVSLSWGKSCCVDSAPVLTYRVDAWQVGTAGGAYWRELGVTSTNGFDAFNLKSGCEYHFRVTPRNRYGWGESVQTSNTIAVGGALCLPEFMKILPGQTKALINRDFVLECIVKGTPKPKVVWYKDGQPLESSDRVSFRQIGSSCRLKIGQVFEIDSGRYTCEATNNQGRASTFARLQVVSDPKIYEADHKLKQIIENEKSSEETLPIFTMRLRDRRVQVTYPVRLTCQVVGNPQPELTWSKDGVELQNSDGWVISNDGQFNILEIVNACLDDSGTYTATAKNELGSVSCHCSLIVDKGIRAYIAPDFYVPLDPIYIFKEGQEIRLAAKVEAYPSVGVAWHRNGVRLRPSRKVIANLDHDGFVELVIMDATQQDAGIYLCVASNPVGRIESSCRVVIENENESNSSKSQIPTLKTSNMPYSKEPMFIKKPRSSEAFEGDTVIIFCEVIGDPKPEVVWLRDFLKPDYYKDAPHFRRIGEGTEYRLEIPAAKLDFTGTYSVIASNCHGEAKAIISLQIYVKDISKSNTMDKGCIKHGNVETLPCVIRHLKDLRCCDSDSITLECYVEGDPEPIILWEKDGRILPSGKDFVISYNGTRATLSIKRVYPEDEGVYTCVASNNIGRAYSSACIIVDVPEEKENLLNRQLIRPPGLLLSSGSTPQSTPRTTPIRSISPLALTYRNTSMNLTSSRKTFAAPKFYAIPHSYVAEEGETVRFQCAIAGHPLPWSTWDKDGIIVTQTTRISIKERDDSRILEIVEVTFDDAGLYRITLENDYGRIEATARLDVISNSRRESYRSIRTSSSPRRYINLSRRIMGNSTRIGGRLALSCNIRGSSVPAKKFCHNGKEVKESSRIRIKHLGNEAALIVEKVRESDEGRYICIAHNDFGIVSTSTSVVFHKSKEDISSVENELEIIQELPKSVAIREAKTTDLVFEINAKQPYIYQWMKDEELLIGCDEFRYIDHGNGLLTLRILDMFDMDGGLYTCIVKTQNSSCSTSCQLTVKEDKFISDSEKPHFDFLKHPLPAIGFRDTVLSSCTRINPQNAKLKWFVCGREVKKDSREFSLENQEDGARILHILGVEYKHGGEVKVIAQHPRTNEEIASYTYLVVLPSKSETLYDFENISNNEHPDVPAYIAKGPKDCATLVRGTVKLEVVFGGYPTPIVRWLKVSRPITENSNTVIRTTENQSCLILTCITTDESGKYTVEVMNEHGSDFAAASVAVEGPPEPPSGKPSVSQGPDHVVVAWCGPPYDGGCILTGYIVEMQEKDKEWIEIATVIDSLAYTVKNLEQGQTYKFRIRAENIHGRSGPSIASEEVTILIKYKTEKNFQQDSINIQPGGDFKTRFEVLEELGKGRFGIVYKVMEKETKQILAAKIIKCIKSRDRYKVQEEILIMKSLCHPKLLNLAATFENTREIIMITEYITGGELFERVVADDFTLTERDCILFLRQICEGVDYMHSQKIVHLDLKPENIMCHTRTSHQIKIIDFGLAQRLTTDTPVRVLFGTPEFIPPEIINYEPISFQSDMWSIGVICYVLLSGLSPFMGDSDVDTFANITRADYDFDDEAFDAVSQEAKDFISSLLIHRKEDRLTAKQCLNSKWLSQHTENVSNNKICTDKLKKFIIRRKWQKTGNAIRALGRMANLSASRRNSTANSNPNSPRPSISTGSSLVNHIITTDHMSSLNEEEDNFNSSFLSVDKSKTFGNVSMSIKIRDKNQCSERSDSGFSECSSCSGNGNISCVCLHPFSTRSHMIQEESHQLEKPLYLSNAVSHELLKCKLKEIVEAQKFDRQTTTTIKTINKSENCDQKIMKLKTKESSSSPQNFTIEVPLEHRNNSNTKSPAAIDTNPLKESIMMSDFTNTIKMRKKSLEKNVIREKVITKTIFEPFGKVSMLKSKFNSNQSNNSQKNSNVSTPAFEHKIGSNQRLSNVRFDVIKSDSVFDRLARNKTKAKCEGPLSLPTSPLSTRSNTRLTGRVKEVTEQLSTPKKCSTTQILPMKFSSLSIPATTIATNNAQRLAQKLDTTFSKSLIRNQNNNNCNGNNNNNNDETLSSLTAVKVNYCSKKKLNLQSPEGRS